MLTSRGKLALALFLLLLIVGRVLGVTELFGVAAAIAVLVIAAVVQCRPSLVHVALSGRVAPDEILRGDRAILELFVENVGSTPTPTGRVQVVPSGGGTHRIVVPRLAPGERASVTIGLETGRRGRRQVKAYDGLIVDTLGLASRKVTTSNTFQYLVRPRTEELSQTLPLASGGAGQEVTRASAERIHSGASLLRPYLEGDDLRLIHWRTTARIGELMVREGGEPDLSGRSGTSVLLVTQSQGGALFERAVEVAASLAKAAAMDGLFRVATTSGYDSGTASGAAHLDQVMTTLSTVEPATMIPPRPPDDRSVVERATRALPMGSRSEGSWQSGAFLGDEQREALSLAALTAGRSSVGADWNAFFLIEAGGAEEARLRARQLAELPPRLGYVVVIEVGPPLLQLERPARDRLLLMLPSAQSLGEVWAMPSESFLGSTGETVHAIEVTPA